MGDSITQGWISHHDTQTYAGVLARWFNADSLNWGVGGTCFYPSCVEKTEFEPDAVIVAYGTNDYVARNSPEQFEKACCDYMENLKACYGDKKVFVITPIWRADHALCRRTGTLTDCANMIRKAAQARGFTVLDGFKLFPHSREYMADGHLHPNDLGFNQYAMNLIKALTPYI